MEAPTARRRPRAHLGAALVSAVGCAAFLSLRWRSYAGAQVSLEADSAYRIVASNRETRNAGYHPGRGYPGLREGKVVEPGALTTLQLEGPDGAPDDVRWEVVMRTNTPQPGLVASHTGASLEHAFSDAGEFTVSATFQVDGEVTSVSDDFSARYVRRSLRTLTPEARNAFFDAVQTTAQVPTDVGRMRYGGNYHNLTYFTALHLINAGGKLSDRMHDGLGFLTQHTALTMAYEMSLRAVDPSVTIPYWDYTYDGEHIRRTGELQDLWKMDIWGEDWFGNASGSNLHTVEAGRWAYQRIDAAYHTEIKNPYGYMRAPWNMNKSPFLTRVHKMGGISYPISWYPACSSHHNMTFAYDDLMDYTYSIYEPHGPVHIFIGGYTMNGDLRERFKGILDEDAIGAFAKGLLYLPKNLYRDGDATLIQYPAHCSADTDQLDCHMVCYEGGKQVAPGHNYSGALWTFVNKVVTETGGNAWANAPSLAGDKANQDRFLDVLCMTPFVPGEQMESASPADVSFWPIHPTMDRILQYKRMVSPFTDASWTDDEPTDVCLYADTSDCKGHHSYDITVFRARVMDVDGNYTVASYTNGEIYSASDPAAYRLDYIYDDFTWAHCDEAGYYFPKLDWHAD